MHIDSVREPRPGYCQRRHSSGPRDRRHQSHRRGGGAKSRSQRDQRGRAIPQGSGPGATPRGARHLHEGEERFPACRATPASRARASRIREFDSEGRQGRSGCAVCGPDLQTRDSLVPEAQPPIRPGVSIGTWAITAGPWLFRRQGRCATFSRTTTFANENHAGRGTPSSSLAFDGGNNPADRVGARKFTGPRHRG
jgi:hypothetical protein